MARERRSGDERKDQIAEAALRHIASDGAARLTAAVLAKAVGVSDAALFRHFESMEAIVEEAIEHFGALLARSLANDDPDPLTRLRAFFVHRLTLVRERPEVLQLAFNDRLADAAGADGAKRVRAIVGRSRTHVLGCLEEARAQGLVRDDLPPEMLAWTVFGFMRGAARAARTAQAPAPEEVWSALARLLAPSSPSRSSTPRRRPKTPARSTGGKS